MDKEANAGFLNECQFRFGGIAKAPGETPGTFVCLIIRVRYSVLTEPRSVPHLHVSGDSVDVSTHGR